MSSRAQSILMTETLVNDIPIIDEKTLQEYQAIAIRRLVRKLDRRLLTFLCLLEAGQYINRTSIGHAKLMGIQHDLNSSQSEIDWAISLFFLAYLIFEIPSIIFMRYLGPTRYLSLSLFAWGSITVGTAFVTNARGLLAVRFFLGAAQAGFFPSMIIYFSLWYRKRDQIMRIAFLFGAAIISCALNSILAYGFRSMGGIGGLHGWQWMFLLEGLPMIPLAIITCLFLHNNSDTVQWLDINEKELLANILRQDAGIANRDIARFSRQQLLNVFIDWRIYLYALINIGISGLIKYLGTSLPLIVKEMNIAPAEVHLMTAPPYAFAFACCLLVSYSSWRRNEHGFHLIFCLFVALLGFILLLIRKDHGRATLYVSTCIACCGVFSGLPLLLSWLTNNIGGHTKKVMGIALVEGAGQIGGIILPLVSNDALTKVGSVWTCIGMITVVLILTIVLRVSLMLENKRRDHLTPEQYAREEAVKESCDWHPQARYVL